MTNPWPQRREPPREVDEAEDNVVQPRLDRLAAAPDDRRRHVWERPIRARATGMASVHVVGLKCLAEWERCLARIGRH